MHKAIHAFPQVTLKVTCFLFSRNETQWEILITLRFLHNITQPCLSVSWPWDMSILFCGPLEQIGNTCLLFIHSSCIWKLGCSYIPDTMRRNYYPSQDHSHETLFISWLFPWSTTNRSMSLKMPTLFTIFLLFKSSLFIICTSVNFFLFSKFLSWRYDSGGPHQMLNIE